MDLKNLGSSKRALSLFEEFKAFAFKGNVIDLAVGVIIGGAFGNIVKSFVDNVLMPLVGLILPGDRGYQGWVFTLRDKTIPYGRFLGDVVNFLIVAFALYLFLVKFMGWIMAAKTEEAATPPPPTTDQMLLAEIRDTLREQARSRPDG